MKKENLMFRFRVMFNSYSKVCTHSTLRLSQESDTRYRIVGVSEELCLFYALYHSRLCEGITMCFCGDFIYVICYA